MGRLLTYVTRPVQARRLCTGFLIAVFLMTVDGTALAQQKKAAKKKAEPQLSSMEIPLLESDEPQQGKKPGKKKKAEDIEWVAHESIDDLSKY